MRAINATGHQEPAAPGLLFCRHAGDLPDAVAGCLFPDGATGHMVRPQALAHLGVDTEGRQVEAGDATSWNQHAPRAARRELGVQTVFDQVQAAGSQTARGELESWKYTRGTDFV